jgi:hypothetical protein
VIGQFSFTTSGSARMTTIKNCGYNIGYVNSQSRGSMDLTVTTNIKARPELSLLNKQGNDELTGQLSPVFSMGFGQIPGIDYQVEEVSCSLGFEEH